MTINDRVRKLKSTTKTNLHAKSVQTDGLDWSIGVFDYVSGKCRLRNLFLTHPHPPTARLERRAAGPSLSHVPWERVPSAEPRRVREAAARCESAGAALPER